MLFIDFTLMYDRLITEDFIEIIFIKIPITIINRNLGGNRSKVKLKES